MAHGKPRTEKNCLNCNAQVNGRFCSVCGQENIEPGESFWQLISHFVYDLFHYDGKALVTLKVLLFKPGVLTFEYVRGKRASYLHPIRMYIFTSATFFIIFISFMAAPKSENHEEPAQLSSAQRGAIQKTIDQLKDSLEVTSDTAKKRDTENEIKALEKVFSFFPASKNDVFFSSEVKIDSSKKEAADSAKNVFGMVVPASLSEYNTQQSKLAPEKKDGWFQRAATTKIIAINEKYKYDRSAFFEALQENFLHSLPKMMFISLPVVAVLFQMLYIRRKRFTYVQHGIFTVHIYCAIYMMILILYALNLLQDYLHWGILGFLITIGILTVFYYIYRAMRNFYEQGRWKTVFKYALLLISYSFVLALLMIIFLLTSLIQV